MNSVISVDGLSKVYRIGAAQGRRVLYRTLRESVTDLAMKPLRSLSRTYRAQSGGRTSDDSTRGIGDSSEFWALKEVAFEVQQGEVVGIVGHNGAGKSTLLKILSRITDPSLGRIRMKGRLGSLLEVGTGFHPELTGRENIFLNGAILGMSRREIARKFDEIVDFAEIEKFLDMPVKRYSSGMYVRLAFAVASHLEPEILVIDEVLAVGDAAFQRKCLGKIGQGSRDGRTVLFVSHNMSAVKTLCSRAILIDRGRIAADGDVDEIVNQYLNADVSCSRDGLIPEDADRQRDVPGEAIFRSVRLTDVDGNEVSQLYYGQSFRVELTCDVTKEIEEGHFEVSISTKDGNHVLYSRTVDEAALSSGLTIGRYQVSAEFDEILLPRAYTIDLGLHHNDGTTSDFVSSTLDFTVLRVAESGANHYPWHRVRGFIQAQPAWNCSKAALAELGLHSRERSER